MKDSDFNKEKRRIQAVRDRWSRWLLPGWSLMVHYCDDRDDMPADAQKEAIAACRARSEYLQADTYWYMPLVKEVDDAELERVAVHEMGHALVHEMRYRGIEHEERVVTELTRSFLWVRDNAERLKERTVNMEGKHPMHPKVHETHMKSHAGNGGAKHTSAKAPQPKRGGVGKRRK